MPGPFALDDATIASVHAAYGRGELSCRALVELYLARIASLDQADPGLNAVITLNPRALDTAAEMDAAWRADRSRCGPLHGIPILVKDNTDTAGMPTTGSSLALRDSRPRKDAFVVARLRAAGALVLAKTALTELAMGGTSAGSLHGQTLNPSDLTRTPGGSSGGTGAGVAASYAVFGTGSDTYQSVRSPASACALLGLRGTRGLVSRTGLMPFAYTQDEIGPMARTAEDLARALDVMAGFDPADPVTDAGVGHIPRSYTAFLDPGALKGRRFGVLRGFFGAGVEHAEVNRTITRGVDALIDGGATVFDIVIPGLETLASNVALGDYELKAGLDRYLAGLDGPVKSYDQLVACGNFAPAIAAQLDKASALGLGRPGYAEALARRAALRRAVLATFRDQRLDALVYPHQRRLVAKVGDEQLERNGVLSNATGLPALCVPGGFSSPGPEAPLGVPIGIEFLGREWSEGPLIGIAFALEQAMKLRRPPLLAAS
jgi:Asp-tRNA(Asn)/Glu-tRNA(Gln) amidotransferase A subunit family amidase